MNESISIGCNQWLSLAEQALKVIPAASRNRSLVARTSMCGWAISNACTSCPKLLYIIKVAISFHKTSATSNFAPSCPPCFNCMRNVRIDHTLRPLHADFSVVVWSQELPSHSQSVRLYEYQWCTAVPR